MESLIARTDVTSVRLFSDHILAGIGSFLNIFCRKTKVLLQRIEALHGQRIYGIVPNLDNSKILVCGGRQFTVLSVKRSENIEVSKDFEPVRCADWFHSGIWLCERQVALMTAHNVVEIHEITTSSEIIKHKSTSNSILYSGLLHQLKDGLLVFSGTVFSEVLIEIAGEGESLHSLKGHRGVIFSISYDATKQLIVSTSDDRSVRIWGPTTPITEEIDTKLYWKTVNYDCKYELYGHSARVMRSFISSDHIVSVGEDASLCFWFYGRLVKRVISHQNGSIWAVHGDKDHIVTGGGDGGVYLHPLSIVKDHTDNTILNIKDVVPKKVVFTSRSNLAILSDKSVLYYYDLDKEKVVQSFELTHTSTYVLMAISCCKQILAITDSDGNLSLFTENCKGVKALKNILSQRLNVKGTMSMHFAGNRFLVLCSKEGLITILSYDNNISIYTELLLPNCKEKWLTSVANTSEKLFILGDRCGNIHVYTKDQKNPLKTFNKVHGRYGPTSIDVISNEVQSTGRDGSIKKFSIDKTIVEYSNKTNVPFDWVEKFLDNERKLVCGFQERTFVVHNLEENSQVINIPCGGGHRSWDAVRNVQINEDESFEVVIKLAYVKNSEIHITKVPLSQVVSENIVKGTHAKEINCLKVCEGKFYISGGEDTSLRISTVIGTEFKDKIVAKHLSNIKTMKLYKINENKSLLVTAGGRAQICVKTIEFNEIGYKIIDILDYMLKGTDRQRKGNKSWKSHTPEVDPETRFMNIDIIKENNEKYTLIAGCSDMKIRLFHLTLKQNSESHMVLLKEIKHHTACILKTRCFQYLNENILLTCTTRGHATFWNVHKMLHDNPNPIYEMITNKAGINSFDLKIDKNNIVLATAGDDNTIYLNLLQQTNKTIEIKSQLIITNYHHAQITGLVFLDDSYLVTSSVDQRVTLAKWSKDEDKLNCELISQYMTDIADAHGLEVVSNDRNSVTVCIYGKGIEVIRITKPR